MGRRGRNNGEDREGPGELPVTWDQPQPGYPAPERPRDSAEERDDPVEERPDAAEQAPPRRRSA